MNPKIKAYLDLFRIRQYYKNVVIFIGVFFGGQLLNLSYWPHLLIGFCLLCVVSSINYIVNDIMDIEKDKAHPEKRLKRPLAAGIISKKIAIMIVCLLIGLLVVVAILEHSLFSVLLGLVLLNGMVYNFILKNRICINVKEGISMSDFIG